MSILGRAGRGVRSAKLRARKHRSAVVNERGWTLIATSELDAIQRDAQLLRGLEAMSCLGDDPEASLRKEGLLCFHLPDLIHRAFPDVGPFAFRSAVQMAMREAGLIESPPMDPSVGSKAADPSSPEDIRAQGWVVGVHNDYRLQGIFHTFWLFTQGNLCIKGEGRSDAEALNACRAAISSLESAKSDLLKGD